MYKDNKNYLSDRRTICFVFVFAFVCLFVFFQTYTLLPIGIFLVVCAAKCIFLELDLEELELLLHTAEADNLV